MESGLLASYLTTFSQPCMNGNTEAGFCLMLSVQSLLVHYRAYLLDIRYGIKRVTMN